MKKKIASVIVLLAVLSLSACSTFEGTMGAKVETFTDDHGRVCTMVKWNQSASIDCDFPS